MKEEATVYEVSPVEQERQVFRKRQGRRSIIISIVSTLVLAAAIVVTLNLAPAWPRVQQTFFSPEYFASSFPIVLEGLWLNVRVLIYSLIGTAIFGTLLAIIRISKSPVLFPLRILAQAYTTVMRGIPMLVVLYIIGFGIPGLGIFGRVPIEVLGTIAVTMSYSAYIAEVLRAGFQDVSPQQRMSARSLGLTSGQTVRLIIIPQALRKIAPALMNDFIAMQKDVGLISTLGAIDAIRAAQVQVALSFNFTPYIVASVLFILLSVPFVILNDWYTAKLRKREQTGGMV